MGWLKKFFSNPLKAVGDVFDAVGDAIGKVANAVGDVIQGAIDDPLGTIVTIAAYAAAPATGGASMYAIPALSAGRVLDNGGSFADALKGAAISYAASTAAGGVGKFLPAAAQGSAQAITNSLVKSATANVASQLMRSGDVDWDQVGKSLANAGLYQGIHYAYDNFGNAISTVTGENLVNPDGSINQAAIDNMADAYENQEVGVDIDAFGREIDASNNPYAAQLVGQETMDAIKELSSQGLGYGTDYTLVGGGYGQPMGLKLANGDIVFDQYGIDQGSIDFYKQDAAQDLLNSGEFDYDSATKLINENSGYSEKLVNAINQLEAKGFEYGKDFTIRNLGGGDFVDIVAGDGSGKTFYYDNSDRLETDVVDKYAQKYGIEGSNSDSSDLGSGVKLGDYSLTGSSETPAGYESGDLGTGLKVELPEFDPDAEWSDPDYSLTPDGTYMGGEGLKTDGLMPNLSSMGGGQGLTVDVEGGTVGELGFTPDGAVVSIGDPDSFINDPEVLDTPVVEQGDDSWAWWNAVKTWIEDSTIRNLSNSLTKDIFDDNGKPVVPGIPRTNTTGGIDDTGDVGQYNASESSQQTNAGLASPSTPFVNAELADPIGNAVWAPQTKLQNLGEAGKYINPGENTYFQSPDHLKALERQHKMLGHMGWTGLDEQTKSPEDPYYTADYDNLTDYGPNKFDPDGNNNYAEGGLIDHNPEFYSEGGASIRNRYVKGGGNGTSDSVPAMLATGEFVIPADVVSGLGNGDNDAGASILDRFMQEIRKHKRSTNPKELPPDSLGPLSYLNAAITKTKRA